MYLKSIRAQGFKSFADKLDLEINPGITGIVGPNGSGKSNIVDAVRWVLGEQSVKQLRGSNSMSDVIFSGSESREPQKRAMVALTFDNNDKYLHSDFNEVEIKSELENIDIALIVKDINAINSEYNVLKTEIEHLKESLMSLKTSENDAELEKIKLKNIELEDKINEKREELLRVSDTLNSLNSEKQITLERQKYEVDNKRIDDNLLKLKEQELSLKKNIDVATRDVADIEASISEERKKGEDVKDKLLVLKVKRSNANNSLMDANKRAFLLQNKIDILENNITNAENTPVSVRNILNNPRLYGIHNTIGKLIEIPDKLVVAVDVALGNAANYIVVDDDISAINAIDFLKERKLGRATFFPINIIKSRYVSSDVIDNIKNIHGFLGVLSDMVSFDEKYRNIIENQLGQVLVVENANTLNVLGKLINYKYRIVSLDGEIQHAGGSITGGTSKKNTMLNEKNELNKLKDEFNKLNVSINTQTKELEELDKEIADAEERED